MGRRTALSVPFGGKPVELAAGDLDGDGRVDLVALNADVVHVWPSRAK